MAISEKNVKSLAAEIAKEVTIAKVSSSTIAPNATNGQCTADFFNAVYSGILVKLSESMIEDKNQTL